MECRLCFQLKYCAVQYEYIVCFYWSQSAVNMLYMMPTFDLHENSNVYENLL
jgi:hypothetical protein